MDPIRCKNVGRICLLSSEPVNPFCGAKRSTGKRRALSPSGIPIDQLLGCDWPLFFVFWRHLDRISDEISFGTFQTAPDFGRPELQRADGESSSV
jgi:hypothetical protein